MSATASTDDGRIRRRFAVAEVMSGRPLLLRAGMRLEPAVALLLDHGFSGAPVIDQRGRLVGMLHALDVALMHLLPPDDATVAASDRRLLVGETCRDAVTISPHSTMRQAADTMRDHHTDRLVVVEDSDRVIGVVTTHDLLRTVSRRGNLLSEIIDQHIAALDMPDVRAHADYAGVVLLTGTVDSAQARDRLIQTISAIDGVIEIEELVTVKPVQR